MMNVAGGNVSGVAQANTARIFIDHVQLEVQVANASLAIANVEIYDYYMRRTNQVATENNNRLPLAFANDAMQAEQNSLLTTPLTVWGASPGESIAMRKMFDRKLKTKIILGPGEVHTHKVFIGLRKVLRAQDLSQYQTNANIPGWTRYISFIGQGQPEDSTLAWWYRECFER